MSDELLEIPPFVREACEERMAFGRLVEACLAIQGLSTEKDRREYQRALKAAAKYFPAQRQGNDHG